MAKLGGGGNGGGPQVFNMNNLNFGGSGGNPFAGLGAGGNPFAGMGGGGAFGGTQKPKMSDAQMRAMARAVASGGTAPRACATVAASGNASVPSYLRGRGEELARVLLGWY